MKLNQLIDMLHIIENRHPGEAIDVEIRDEDGFPTLDLELSTEYHFAAKRITVRFVPIEKSEDGK